MPAVTDGINQLHVVWHPRSLNITLQ